MVIIIKILADTLYIALPPYRPRYFSSKRCRGWLHRQRPVCWRCALRLLNQPYLMSYTHEHIHARTNVHIRTRKGRNRMEPLAITYTNTARVVNDSFYIRRQSKDLLQRTLASIFLMRARILYHVSLLINYNLRYK